MTLTDFLLARIAEDEANGWSKSGLRAAAYAETRAHRECEAKRRIVEMLEPDDWDGDRYSMDGNDWFVVASLAVVYVDHPDYRDEWKP